MLRAIGINVPTDESDLMATNYDHISGVGVEFYGDQDERCIMDKAGWDIDSTPVDVFMRHEEVGFRYIGGMLRDRADHH